MAFDVQIRAMRDTIKYQLNLNKGLYYDVIKLYKQKRVKS